MKKLEPTSKNVNWKYHSIFIMLRKNGWGLWNAFSVVHWRKRMLYGRKCLFYQNMHASFALIAMRFVALLSVHVFLYFYLTNAWVRAYTIHAITHWRFLAIRRWQTFNHNELVNLSLNVDFISRIVSINA